jgi:hypothetical protein
VAPDRATLAAAHTRMDFADCPFFARQFSTRDKARYLAAGLNEEHSDSEIEKQIMS